MTNKQPFNRDHKTITEARSLVPSLPSLTLATVTSPRGRRELNGKSRKEGGIRIPIESTYRWYAEKKHRMTSKRQLRKVIETGEGIVENIAYCQPWDWRW